MLTSNIFRNVLFLSNKLNTSSGFCTKTLSNEYIPVYKFPYIRACGIINQLKYYQSLMTTVAIPTSCILNNYGFLSTDHVITTSVLGVSGTLSLFLLGLIPYKLVGFIYVKQDDSTIKISYLNFWGRRKDEIIPLNDLVPFSDLPTIPTDPVYLTMRRFSNKETFKINLKLGMILEKDKFKEVFLPNK